jgi:tRNA-Thr(GGU) m(6)t(6)A37 methyltransferase TsaA
MFGCSRGDEAFAGARGRIRSMGAPRGWHSLTPRIVTDDVAGLCRFLQQAFGAAGEVTADRPVVMEIGDSRIMVSAVGPRPATPAFLYLYVDDADAIHARAVAAGARSLEAPLDTPYGDRRGMVEDRWGNVWQIATPARPGAGPANLRPIGRVRSALTERSRAPRQGNEGAPDAWIDVEPAFVSALAGLEAGDELVVITWFHQASRDVLQVHPRGEPTNPLAGVFATRSPDRPNPLGLHRVTIRSLAGASLQVGPLEAIDGTPVVDLKPALGPADG